MMTLPEHHFVLVRSANLSESGLDFSSIRAMAEVHDCVVDSLTIDTVRTLTQVANRQPVDAKFKYLLIQAQSITIEAQQALLKLLEEPPATTRVIMCVPVGEVIIPTIISRSFTVEQYVSLTPSVIFRQFLQSSLLNRLDQIATAQKKKDNYWFMQMYQGVIVHVTLLSPRVAQDLLPLISYLPKRGTSKKMVWEAIALILPLTK